MPRVHPWTRDGATLGDTPRFPYKSQAAETRRRFPTSGGIDVTPPPHPPDQTLNHWWQSIITLCVGLAAVGGVVWFLASNFFITKEKFDDDRRVRDAVQSAITDELRHVGQTLADMNKTVKEIGAQVTIISTDLAVIKATRRR